MKRILYIIIIPILAITNTLFASDTLKVSINTADSLFQLHNFNLLASSMNIEAQKAQIIQAKTFPNPILSGEVNAYDPDNKQLLHAGQSGQKAFQIEQLIRLGGKRKSEIDMAKTNSKIAELEFQQLVRKLKFQLHSQLFSIGQQKLLLAKYHNQLTFLDTILSAYEIQGQKGNIALRDIVRLKGAYLKLNNDRAELLKNYYDTQTNLQILLQTNTIIDFDFTESSIHNYIKSIPLDELKKEALTNKPEYLIQLENKTYMEHYLSYQKKQAIPDLTFYSSYNQGGGAFRNEINAGMSMPLPLWNRNKGNIKTAEYQLNETDYITKAIEIEIISSIQNHYELYTQTVSELLKATKLYNSDFDITIKGMNDNFQKRNLSIIEYVDFFESYYEVLSELTRIKSQLVISAEQLNLLIGKDLY